MNKRSDKMIKISKDIGNRLKFERGLLGLSQEEMAFRLGVSDRQYRRYELGESTISLHRFQELYELFHIDVNYLIVGDYIEDVYITRALETMPDDMYTALKQSCLNILHNQDNSNLILSEGFDTIKDLINYGEKHMRSEKIREVEPCDIFKTMHEESGVNISELLYH